MRNLTILVFAIVLAACDAKVNKAKHIVARELGAPTIIDFRNVTKNAEGTMVCGEVAASDKPGRGWRRFNAFITIDRAVIAADDSPMTSAAEMGNPMLKGEAERFNHACE